MLTSKDVTQLVDYERGRVHASVYMDPEIFETELARIFYKTWIYIGHESEIAQPGDYKTAYIGRVPIIVSRTEDNKIHVLVNRCVHRGTTVCQWEYGNSNYFRCEYHGWTYRNDGSLLGVTLRKGYTDAEFQDIPRTLEQIPRVETYRGLIFASLDADVEPLDAYLGVTKRYLDDWFDTSPTGQLEVTGGVWRHHYEGNWKLGLEGSDERYHVDHLHKIASVLSERMTGVRMRMLPSNLGDLETIDAGHGHGISEIRNERFPLPYREMYPSEYIDALVAAQGQERTEQVLCRTFRLHLFPNVAFGPENIRIFRPVGPELTEVLQYHVSLPDISGVTDGLNRERFKAHQRAYGPAGYIGPDDLEMFPRIQEGLRSRVGNSLNPWIWFARGSTMATTGPEGELRAADQSELSQRAIYGGWVELMKHDTPVEIDR